MDAERRCPVCGERIKAARSSTADAGLYGHLDEDHDKWELINVVVQMARRREYERLEQLGDGADA